MVKRSRITILAEDVEETSSGAFAFMLGNKVFYVSASLVLSVEDHVEPLPTTPGERFWGKTTSTEPQWWFIQQGAESLWCISADGLSWRRHDAIHAGLVRLPDPEATP